jgi:GTPase
VQVVGELVQSRHATDPAYFLGKGKSEELARMASELQANVVIANRELTPSQIKHLEKRLNIKVIDRTQLILHIFAERATSKEGKLQVELAQLKYLLPRLIGHGVDLSRLGGGIGSKGPGETKLELDRRKIRDQIHRLEVELKKVSKHRELHSRRRAKNELATIALVGYTNAGKSTLFRRLVEQYGNADAKEGHNRLFDTLETTSRKLVLPFIGELMISDTVGFIQDLPHHLVESFRSTLEGVIQADLLLHVVDASDEKWSEQLQTVYEVLDSLDAKQKQILTVFNKVDQIIKGEEVHLIDSNADAVQLVSAKTGFGILELLQKITSNLVGNIKEYQLQIPYQDGLGHAEVHSKCEVVSEQHMDSVISYLVRAVDSDLSYLRQYIVS